MKNLTMKPVRASLCLCVAAMALGAFPAAAGSIIQSRSFDLSAEVLGLGTYGDDTFQFIDQFNPSNGSLDSVDVTMIGEIAFNFTLPPNLVPVVGTGEIGPQPYIYNIFITQHVPDIVIDQYPTVFLTGVPDGVGTVQLTGAYTYEYSFSLTAGTDLEGFALVDRTHLVTTSFGDHDIFAPFFSPYRRSGFTEDDERFLAPFPIFPILSVSYSDGSFSGSDDAFGLVTSTGTTTVTYNFTEPAVAAPEPSALALFGLGLAGLGFAGRRRIADVSAACLNKAGG